MTVLVETIDSNTSTALPVQIDPQIDKFLIKVEHGLDPTLWMERCPYCDKLGDVSFQAFSTQLGNVEFYAPNMPYVWCDPCDNKDLSLLGVRYLLKEGLVHSFQVGNDTGRQEVIDLVQKTSALRNRRALATRKD